MSRILKAYRTRFHQTLRKVGARRVDQGVDWLVRKAEQLTKYEKITLADALSRVWEELASRPHYQASKRAQPRTPDDIFFFCDAGLGGLARWLRAAGYRAFWESGIADDQLLSNARELSATVITTDSMLMERRVLRDRVINSMWLPPTLSISEQLGRVLREFELSVGKPRCMSCGGELLPGDKEALKDRIPPRTYRWLNEYFVCASCGKLFWHGTHWQSVVERLKHPACPPPVRLKAAL
jgi:uncharacterized protein with PIN domain